MHKRIELSDPILLGTKTIVTIKKQTHTTIEFGNSGNGDKFIASNGVTLFSFLAPEAHFQGFTFVRGAWERYNEDPLIFSTKKEYNDFVCAVNEYNTYFS